MERKTNTNGTEPNEAASLAGTCEVAEPAMTAAPEVDGTLRRYLGVGWRFARHLLEMVVAMMLGMGVFGLALAVMGEPSGYANLLVRYGLMGAFMAAPMVGWMRFRGHSWREGGEMTAAMVVPMLAPVLPVELGAAVPGLTEGSLMMVSHVAMIAGMVLLMLYRFDRYARGPYGHRVARSDSA